MKSSGSYTQKVEMGTVRPKGLSSQPGKGRMKNKWHIERLHPLRQPYRLLLQKGSAFGPQKTTKCSHNQGLTLTRAKPGGFTACNTFSSAKIFARFVFPLYVGLVSLSVTFIVTQRCFRTVLFFHFSHNYNFCSHCCLGADWQKHGWQYTSMTTATTTHHAAAQKYSYIVKLGEVSWPRAHWQCALVSTDFKRPTFGLVGKYTIQWASARWMATRWLSS